MKRTLVTLAMLSLIFSGAIFGFFYAWVCSTMWGLDTMDAKAAITAMKSMNVSVRNFVFAPAFFGTTVVLWMTGVVAALLRRWDVAGVFATAGLIYLVGAQLVTITKNVPLNQSLAMFVVTGNVETAEAVWKHYSEAWQFWNQTRTAAAGVTLLVSGYGLFLCGRETGSDAS